MTKWRIGKIYSLYIIWQVHLTTGSPTPLYELWILWTCSEDKFNTKMRQCLIETHVGHVLKDWLILDQNPYFCSDNFLPNYPSFCHLTNSDSKGLIIYNRYFGLRILKKILDFYKNFKFQNTGLLWIFLSKYWTSTKFFVEIQYFDKKNHRSRVFRDLKFL